MSSRYSEVFRGCKDSKIRGTVTFEGTGPSEHGSGSRRGEGDARHADIELAGATVADQDFIAHARQDVPRLLAEVVRLRRILRDATHPQGAGQSMSGAAPSFMELSSAIDFIARALETGDHGTLADACVTAEADCPGLPTRREYRLHAIKLLAHVHAENPLRVLYAGRAFPSKESRFKLGGHAQELGHLHLDFVREGSAWRIENVWQCR